MDLADRAKQIVELAQQRNLHPRILGGLALYLLAPTARDHAVLMRAYKDIDLVASRKDGGKLTPILEQVGFVPDRRFNALHGETRLLYFDKTDPLLQVDVFVGLFVQCHKLDLLAGSEAMDYTITPTYLLLSKLQIVELNEKDVRDIITMLLDWPLGFDDTGINQTTLENIFGTDWGLLTTAQATFEKVSHHTSQYLTDEENTVVNTRMAQVRAIMGACPKSVKFRLRQKIGRKIPWYDIPEEVRR